MEISQYIWPVAAFAAGVAAWFCAVLLVLTQALHGHFSVGPAANLQNAHKEPTPRIGGVAIFFSVVLGVLLSGGESRRLLLGIVLAGTPAFAFGLLEDCTHRVSASARLFATLGSGVLGWFVTGLAISDINLPGIDALLAWTPLAVLFTAFCVGGVANAFNIIDGLNGLAGGTALILLSAMGLLSLHLGDAQLAHVCLILAGATLGFLLVNWPFGKLFLGDGGAYFVGFAVAWVAVMLLYRHPEVSAWCSLRPYSRVISAT
ncbi:MAG: MraY family glycosyltransferase, partial [Rhodoferax sp.]